MVQEEEWRPIPGWVDYEASSYGQVRSLKSGSQQVLKPGLHTRGYMTVHLSPGVKRDGKSYLVHRLVLEAFVGPRSADQQCRHLDGDKTNNRLDNLRWGTGRENHADSVQHGTALLGPKNHKTKLTKDQVLEIRVLLGHGLGFGRIGERYGVCGHTIRDIKRGTTWRHLP